MPEQLVYLSQDQELARQHRTNSLASEWVWEQRVKAILGADRNSYPTLGEQALLQTLEPHWRKEARLGNAFRPTNSRRRESPNNAPVLASGTTLGV